MGRLLRIGWEAVMCRIQALPPTYVLKTKDEAGAILRDPNASYSLKKLAWAFLKGEHKGRKEPLPDGEAAE